MKSFYISQATKCEQKAMALWQRADFCEARMWYREADMWQDRAAFYAREAVNYYMMADSERT